MQVKTTGAKLACVASVSARVRRESRDESEKKKEFFCSRSNFRAITRLETLATQAIYKCAHCFRVYKKWLHL